MVLKILLLCLYGGEIRPRDLQARDPFVQLSHSFLAQDAVSDGYKASYPEAGQRPLCCDIINLCPHMEE